MAAKASELLRDALRIGVAPHLRKRGFKGSVPTWRRTNEDGDVAMVNVQLSFYNTAEAARAYVNLSVVPALWWEWEQHKYGQQLPKQPAEYHGLCRRRLEPPETARARPDSWEVTDADTAESAAASILDRLEEDGLPWLENLLDRGALLDALRHGGIGDLSGSSAFRDSALVVMLSAEGGSEFDDACSRLLSFDGPAGSKENVLALLDWARQR